MEITISNEENSMADATIYPSAYSAPVLLDPGFAGSSDRNHLGLIERHPYVSLYISGFENRFGSAAHPFPLDIEFFKDDTRVSISPINILPKGLNQWEIKFATTGLDSGLYRFTATGSVAGVEQTIEGNFELGYLTRLDYFTQVVRGLLFDEDFSRYHVNLYNESQKWSDSLINFSLSYTLSAMNSYKIASTAGHGLTFDTVLPQLEFLLINGTLAQCLRSRQTYEVAEAHTTQASAVSINYARDYSALADRYQAMYDTQIDKTILGHWIKSNGIYDKLGKGRKLRYVENFVLMAMVPFGHNVWVI
jgi:hypothetical protein